MWLGGNRAAGSPVIPVKSVAGRPCWPSLTGLLSPLQPSLSHGLYNKDMIHR